MADRVVLSSLATAAGTLVLAAAVFSSVRSTVRHFGLDRDQPR